MNYLNTENISRSSDGVEYHPLIPFLPDNAKVLFLGSFPPQRKRWCMDFYYPNFINDHWRIEGEVFFADRNHFVDQANKCFRVEGIIEFCHARGIAFFDTATAVRRLKDNASDEHLEVVEPTDIRALLQQLPHCEAIVTTGQKATDTLCAFFGLEERPKVGGSVPVLGLTNQDGQQVRLYRLPSSSRAYPLAFDKKVAFYRAMFQQYYDLHPQLFHYAISPAVKAFSTTRHGGCGTGNYASFNINPYCGDTDEHVTRNRHALCQLLGIGDTRLVMPHQTHGTRVLAIDKTFLSLPAEDQQAALEGVDALTTNLADICIGVSTADCIPLLLYDDDHHAVAAVHAGWRGTVRRITEKAVQAMTAAYGTRPERLVAQIGPGICLDSFEVGDEVYEAFCQERFDMSPISRLYPAANGREKWHIDLPECNRQQLLAVGVSPQHIHCSGICTYQQHADFFSARRLGLRSGRIFTGICVCKATI